MLERGIASGYVCAIAPRVFALAISTGLFRWISKNMQEQIFARVAGWEMRLVIMEISLKLIFAIGRLL